MLLHLGQHCLETIFCRNHLDINITIFFDKICKDFIPKIFVIYLQYLTTSFLFINTMSCYLFQLFHTIITNSWQILIFILSQIEKVRSSDHNLSHEEKLIGFFKSG